MTSIKKIGPELNAYKFSFDEKKLDEIRRVYREHVFPLLETPEVAGLFKGGKNKFGPIGLKDQLYYYATYDEEPLLWISNNNQHTYEQFKEVFGALNFKEAVKPLVDFEEDITFYSGFFVVCNHAHNKAWHLDYAVGANAYTLITPLFPLENGHGNLLYKDQYGDEQTYVYKTGEAVFFGDHFSHATEPYSLVEIPRILLSLTFGTDKLQYWDTLRLTIGGQSEFLVMPCGHQSGSCKCLLE